MARKIKGPLFVNHYPKCKGKTKEIQRLAYETICLQTLSATGIDEPITITKRAVKEWLNQPFADVVAKNEALLALPELMENAIYCGFGVDKHMATAQAHIFEVSINGRRCWVIVRKFHNGEWRLHSISDNETILDIIIK